MPETPQKPSEDMQKQELLTLLSQLPPFNASQVGQDMLDGFALQLGEPLPTLSTETAAAYAVHHPKHPAGSHYAVICAGGLPLRLKAIDLCKGLFQPTLVPLAAAGEIWISTLGERRMVLVFERPKGRPLTELIAENKRYPERFIADQILAPLVTALLNLAEASVVHGRIRLSNVYYGDRVTLGECLSEPCGYSQDYRSEPPERISLLPYAKGEANRTADCYALGILALQLAVGKERLRETTSTEFMQRLLHEGSMAYLIGNEEFSDHFQDFFRGVLADNLQERWGLPQLKSWLEGKRFNILHGGAPRDAARPYLFAGQELGNMRAIAHAYFTHWEAAKTDLRDNKLRRWVTTSAHKKEMSDSLQRVANSAGGEASRANERSTNDFVARSLLFLDPSGPLRYKTVSAEVDGLGGVVAHAYRTQSQEELQSLAEMIDLDLITSWSGLQKDGGGGELAASQMWKLQRVRMLLRVSSLGSGMERCLYDLNPTLACQSPLIVQHHALTPAAVLQALDKVARAQAAQQAPVDRHIAAFLCSHQDITKDVRIMALSFAPGLMTNYDLIALELLRTTQSKIGNPPLVGLTLWMAVHLLDVVDRFHHRGIRRSLRKDLVKAAQSGMMKRLSDVILNVELIREDEEGFAQARQQYSQLAGRIRYLNSVQLLTARAKEWGARLALGIGLVLLAIVSYNTFLEK